MGMVRKALLGTAGLVLGVTGALGYAAVQIQKPAVGNPDEFRARGSAPGQSVVVCLGASIVHGRVSVDFVELLRRRLPPGAYAFVNAGVNGDLAYNALLRLDGVIACAPDHVVMLVGTNDVQSTLSDRIRRMLKRGKLVPREPGVEWYGENLREIVRQLQGSTRANVGICSLPVLGEDLTSPANRRVREFNSVIQQVAGQSGAAYLPVHERQAEYLTRTGRAQGRAYTDSPALLMAAALQHYLLGQSFDTISRRNGLALTTDLIHMNSVGAGIIAGEIEKFLAAG